MTSQKSIDEIGPVPVGPIAYGCWRLDAMDIPKAARCLEVAIERGMTLIDTADIYGMNMPAGFGSAEQALGTMLQKRPGLRDKMVLATKGGILPPTPYNSSQDYLIAACEASLKRLGVERIDLYQIHRPDLVAHPAEIAAALDRLYQEGKVAAFGVSNYSVSQTSALMRFMTVPFVSQQLELSAWQLDPIENGLLDQCLERDLTCLAWSPLGGGALASGHPREDMDSAALGRVIKVLDRIAAEHEVTRVQVALAFLRRHPARIIPIVGTQNEDRIIEAANAATVSLGRRDWYDIYEARKGRKMP